VHSTEYLVQLFPITFFSSTLSRLFFPSHFRIQLQLRRVISGRSRRTHAAMQKPRGQNSFRCIFELSRHYFSCGRCELIFTDTWMVWGQTLFGTLPPQNFHCGWIDPWAETAPSCVNCMPELRFMPLSLRRTCSSGQHVATDGNRRKAGQCKEILDRP